MQKEANKGCRGHRRKRKHVMNMETSSLYFGPLAKDFGTIPRLMKRRTGQLTTYFVYTNLLLKFCILTRYHPPKSGDVKKSNGWVNIYMSGVRETMRRSKMILNRQAFFENWLQTLSLDQKLLLYLYLLWKYLCRRV